MQKKKIKLRWDNILKDALIAAAIVVFCLVVYITAEPIEQPEATTETTGSEYITKSYFDVPLSESLQDHILELCESYEVAPEIVIAIIERESDYDATDIGDNGKSYGLMQIRKHSHEDRIDRLGVTDLLDPYQNVAVGIDYLAELLNYYEGNTEKALIAYNAGRTGAKKHFFSKGIYSNDYSKEVLENSKILKEGMIQMPIITDDPHKDFDRYEAEKQAQLEKLPQCCCCEKDEYIQDDHYFLIEGDIYCYEHMVENFRKDTGNYIE